jgi:parvulin-like peptidyl-prolyl isomerase
MIPKKAKLLLAVLGLTVALGLAQEVVEEIVAVVNDDIITLSQFKHEYDTRVQAARAQLQGDDFNKFLTELKTGLMDAMITDLLLLQMARERNLNVTEQVKLAIENIKKENKLESDDDLKRALQSQGMEWNAWLKQLEETLLRQGVVVQDVNRSLVLDDAEVVAYYKKNSAEFIESEEYKIRAVYLASEKTAAAALEAKKKEIDDKIKSGSDFTELAGTYSDDPLKELKGDLGTIKKKDLDKTLLQAVEKLKKGDVSSWVPAKAGWYLIKLEDKKDSRLLAFDEAKKTIEEKLYSEMQNVKIKEFMDNIKKNSYIKILKPNPLNL